MEWAQVPAAVRRRINHIAVIDEPGLSLRPGTLHGGKNSGYQAIGLASMWGATQIVLLGFDFQRTDGKSHHHGDHEGGLPNLGTMSEWVRLMIRMAADLRARGVEVINASRETAITCFERLPIEKALQARLDDSNRDH